MASGLEQYTTKSGASNGIQSARVHASEDTNYDRRTASNGEPYFVLKAREVVGRSETYSSKYGMRAALLL